MLIVDGLHHYASVAKDFFVIESYFADNAIVMSHDYSNDFPYVTSFVNELGRNPIYKSIDVLDSFIGFVKPNKALINRYLCKFNILKTRAEKRGQMYFSRAHNLYHTHL